MKNYEEMSDLEINAAVTNLVYGCDGWELNWTNNCFFHCVIDGSGYYRQAIHNYCNNPSDAWPVIVSNKICIQWYEDGHGIYASASMATSDESNNSFISDDENPLRAACICFLKMKDAEL